MLLRAGSGRERMLERTLADGVGQGELPKWLMPSLIAGTAIVVSMEFMVVGLVPVFVDELGISLGQAAWLVSVFALAAGVV